MLNAGAVSAQDLPLLPQDPAVKRSIFPNGLSCYAAENKTCKGAADFTLVGRDYEGKEELFSQKNVVLSSEQVVDSMLLSLMRRVEKDAAPADCAVIVCGDIDAGSVMTKLKYMSLMVDASSASPLPEYTWNEDGKVRVCVNADTLKGLSTVRFEWHAPRVPFQNMNTIQSAVFDKAAWELGDVATKWIKRSLRKQGIPYADVTYLHVHDTYGFTDEKFIIDVTVMLDDALKAQTAAAYVLSSLDRGDASVNDALLVGRNYMHALESSANRPVLGNDEYTAMCRESFLYNGSLSTDKERLAFFNSKIVQATTLRNIFNKMASALLDIEGPYDTVSLSSAAMPSDTLGLPVPSELKTKMRSSRKDSFSGGQIWTFANGFKVVYRKVASTDKRLYYSLALDGGFGYIEDLEAGEGAYISDYHDNCWIAGMKSSDFKETLSLCGMTMQTKVNMFNTVISGHVEGNNASLMMKSLLAVVNECRPDTLEMNYYVECDSLRQRMLSGNDVKATIDSLMCPGYRYTSYKSGSGISQSTFAKAEALFESLTSRMNDGVLVLIGEMDESELKKSLQSFVGEFKVKKAATRRPMITSPSVRGWTSYSAEGESDAAVLVATAPLAMNAVNHFAAEIAAMIIERRTQGDVSFSRNIYPDERFSIMVTLHGEKGQEEMEQIKNTIASCQWDVTDAELKFCKEYLKNSYQLHLQTVDYWLHAMTLRHMEGKDFTTGNAAKIDAVTPQVLQQVFKAIANGSGMEYITTKK